MPPIAALNNSEEKVAQALAEFEYLTQKQLTLLTGSAVSAVSAALRRLQLFEYVKEFDLLRPSAYRLTARGARAVDARAPRDRAYSAIQQIVHTAQAVIHLRDIYPGARLLRRVDLYAHGLHPAVGEHAVQTVEGWVFFLVDDYMMRPGRVRDCWTRTHKPVGRFVDIEALRARGEFLVHRWCDAACAYHAFTTDERQLARFEKVRERDNVPVQLHYLEPIWRLSK